MSGLILGKGMEVQSNHISGLVLDLNREDSKY
jgi:hypothetical protein